MVRKTPKKAVPTGPKKRRFRITVEGQPMLVEHTPDWTPKLGLRSVGDVQHET